MSLLRQLLPQRCLPPAPLRCLAVLAGRKAPTAFVCSSCGDAFPKWAGKCPSCGEYNTVGEFREALQAPGAPPQHNVSPAAVQRSWLSPGSATVLRLAPLATFSSAAAEAWSLGSVELDRLLGGRGLTLGSSTLFSGAPGVGKSTLLLQMAGLLSGARKLPAADGAAAGSAAAAAVPYATFFGAGSAAAEAAQPPHALRTVAYISGEESAAQLKGRAERLRMDAPGLLVLNETKLEDVLAQLSAAYDHTSRSSGAGGARLSAVIVDSIQTMWTEGLPSHAGTVSQVKECAVKLTAFAKATGVPVIMVGHVNKAGDIAGPRVLEHVVDCVLYMEGAEESSGESAGGGGGGGGGGGSSGMAAGAPSHGHRVVRALKNRFGSTSEVGLFQMGEEGFTEAQPAQLFLSSAGASGSAAAGCAVAVAAEGSRPLCVEVQALVQRAGGPYPRARACGVSLDRLHLLTAVLARHTPLAHSGALAAADVMVNVVGGLRLSDPSSELALALAIASSTLARPLARGTVYLGEVGLTGEVRGAVPRVRERLLAARALGFVRAVLPRGVTAGGALAGLLGSGFELAPVDTVAQAVELSFPGGVGRGSGGGGRGQQGGM